MVIEPIQKMLNDIALKPTWSAKEIISKLYSASDLITNMLDEDRVIVIKSTKKCEVKEIKKYDILYLTLVGIPHYFLVHRIIDDKVYGIIFSTKDKDAHNLYKVEKDRIFQGSYATNSYLCVSLDEAKISYIRTYENRKEADEIFKLVKAHYKKLFK